MKKYTSYFQIRNDIEKGDTSCQKLVNYYLKNIHAKKHLNCFLEVYQDEALARAEQIDQKFSRGQAGRLAGIVIALKDVLCYKDHTLQAGSKILQGFESQFTASAVQSLLDEDAIIIGRNNCDEFAMGSSCENSAFGPVLNDLDHERVPGGSSGGAAVAVQTDMCLASLGTDTGGSVRQPASFCGIVGLKPTYSRISRHGLLAYASSFDIIGIFSHCIEDCALVLEILAGKDDFDSTVSQKEVPSYSTDLTYSGKAKIAYIKETLVNHGLNSEVKNQTLEKLDFLSHQGHTVEAVDFPLLDYVLPTYYILTTAEASSNLSRYDGVKYGYRSSNGHNLESMYKKTRSEGFGEEVIRRIMLGTFVLSANYYDAYYTKAQKVRRLIKEKTKKLLSHYDFIMLPTSPTTAFKLGEHTSNPLEMYLADLFTVQASVAGIPSFSIPNGLDSNGMPIGLQIMADDFQEANLLAFSKYIMDN